MKQSKIITVVVAALASMEVSAEHTALPAEPVLPALTITITTPTPTTSTTQPDIKAAQTEIDKTSGGVTIVDTEQVREGRVSNFNDSLGLATGVLAQSRFGSEETRLSIRGSGLQRTFHGRGLKLMQDGIPVNLADGSFDFGAIEPLSARYIEVYRGANALQYGSTNLGGVIDFISPTGYTAPKFEVRTELGSFGYKKLGLTTGGVEGDLDYFVSGSIYDQDSFRNDAHQAAQRLNANLGYKVNEQVETRFYAGYTNNDSDLPGNISKTQSQDNPRQSQYEADPLNPILIGTGQWERNIDLWRVANKTVFSFDDTTLELSAFYSNKKLYHPIVDLAYLSFLPFPPFSTGTFATIGVIDQKTDDYGISARLKHDNQLFGRKNEIIFGISPTYGETRDRRFRNFNGQPGPLTNDFDLTAGNLEIFTEDRLSLTPQFTLIGGLQYARATRKANDNFINPATGNESFSRTYTQTSPKLGVLYDIQPHVQLFANVSRSFEPPSFGEISNPAAASSLTAQKGTTFEVGSRGSSTHVDWDIAAYYARLQAELLASSPTPGVTDTVNADRTIHAGLEMGLTARLPLNLEWRSSLLINDFKFDGDPTFGDNHLAGIQRSILRGELLYRKHGFYAGPTIEASPQRYNVDFAETLFADSYTLLGFKLGQQYDKHWSWFLEGRNLTNKKYAATTDVLKQANAGGSNAAFSPGDGRSFYFGLQWRY